MEIASVNYLTKSGENPPMTVARMLENIVKCRIS